VSELGVDGFRFDLASVLGRAGDGFSREHALFREIRAAPALKDVKLIAEPWDLGPGGYQLGGFPADWAEWNDQYRDTVRRFWRQDPGVAPDLARRVHGSSDIFEAGGRGPWASINFVASHDGFTTADVVSFAERHNEANGEGNRDGHVQNYSQNFGVEGGTENPEIIALRRRERLNMLMTLLLSHGTPMLLAGDEFGNSQQGNNNAYAQDNETGWLDWSGLAADPDFHRTATEIIHLRRNTALLREDRYRHGSSANRFGWRDIEWLRPDGDSIGHGEWPDTASMSILLASTLAAPPDGVHAVALALNRELRELEFMLPHPGDLGHWQTVAATGEATTIAPSRWRLAPLSALCCRLRLGAADGSTN
jgi:isoamylase